MRIYIRDNKEFKTIYTADIGKWSLPISTAIDETGGITIPTDGDTYLDHWVYADDNIFLITASSPKDGTNALTISDPSNIFDRTLIWPDNPTLTYGDFIATQVTSQFINCSDAAYKVPYITVVNSDHTAFIEPELDDAKLYSLKDIIEDAKASGVNIRYTIVNQMLQMTISTKTDTNHNVVFEDGKSKLNTESYENTFVAKVTVAKPDTEGVYAYIDYYLSDTGNISTTVPSNRADGKWVFTEIAEDEDSMGAVEAIIADNIRDHKIEFYSEYEFELWDLVSIKLMSSVFQTRITSMTKTSGNNMILYKCGELKTTLTEKLDANITTPTNKTSSNSFVVAEGAQTALEYSTGAVTGTWHWKKYADGTALCYSSDLAFNTPASWGTWGSAFNTVGTRNGVAYPDGLFINDDIASVLTLLSSGGWGAYIQCDVPRLPTHLYTQGFSFSRPTNPGAATSFKVVNISIGRWN